jgi:hypothetical protein
MKVTCSPETSVDFQRTTRRYIPEDRTHNHRCENLDFYFRNLVYRHSVGLLERGTARRKASACTGHHKYIQPCSKWDLNPWPYRSSSVNKTVHALDLTATVLLGTVWGLLLPSFLPGILPHLITLTALVSGGEHKLLSTCLWILVLPALMIKQLNWLIQWNTVLGKLLVAHLASFPDVAESEDSFAFTRTLHSTCHEPDESSPHLHTAFLKMYFNIVTWRLKARVDVHC